METETESGGVEHILLAEEDIPSALIDPSVDDVESVPGIIAGGRIPLPLEQKISVGVVSTGETGGGREPVRAKTSMRTSLKVEDTILRLNIGGASYRIRTRSILKYGPTTLLGRFVRMDHEHRRSWADAFFEESDEYFFERVPR